MGSEFSESYESVQFWRRGLVPEAGYLKFCYFKRHFNTQDMCVQKLLIIPRIEVLVFWSPIRWMLITVSSYSVLRSNIWAQIDSMAFYEWWSVSIRLIDPRNSSENQERTDKMTFECVYQKVNKKSKFDRAEFFGQNYCQKSTFEKMRSFVEKNWKNRVKIRFLAF